MLRVVTLCQNPIENPYIWLENCGTAYHLTDRLTPHSKPPHCPYKGVLFCLMQQLLEDEGYCGFLEPTVALFRIKSTVLVVINTSIELRLSNQMRKKLTKKSIQRHVLLL